MSELSPVDPRVRVGLDIGGTKIHAVVVGPGLEVLAEDRCPTGWGPQEIVENAVTITRSVVAEADHGIGDVKLVGVGIPGAVDPAAGVVQQALNLGIEDLALARALRAQLGVTVHVENDVNAAALGVAAGMAAPEGIAHSPRSLAFLNLGTGTAAGLVLDGAVWRGRSGAAGEIGHLPVDPTGLRCHCGQIGCLETVTSGSGILAQWQAERGDAPLNMAELPALAETDALAATILGRLQYAVAAAVRALILTVDVEMVVLGGGIAGMGAPLFTGVLKVLRGWESGSALLTTLDLSGRLTVLRAPGPVGAIGAALAGRVDRTMP